jgi:hypothetical protein
LLIDGGGPIPERITFVWNFHIYFNFSTVTDPAFAVESSPATTSS